MTLAIMLALGFLAMYISATVYTKHSAPWGAIAVYWFTVAVYWGLKTVGVL